MKTSLAPRAKTVRGPALAGVHAPDVWTGAFVFSLYFAVAAIATLGHVAMAGAAIAVAFSYFMFETRSADGMSLMSVYAVGAGLSFGVANLAGYLAQGSKYEPVFETYFAPDHVHLAQSLALAGLVLPIVSFRAVLRTSLVREIKQIGGTAPDRTLIRFAIGVVILTWASRLGVFSAATFGIAGSFLARGPSVFVFVLRRRAMALELMPLSRWVHRLTVAVMLSEVVYQGLNSILRTEAVWPVVAFLLPKALGVRAGVLVRRGLALAVLFALLFQPLGVARSQRVNGVARIQTIRDAIRNDNEGVVDSVVSFAARLSTYNQLSQVGRLASEEGRVNGATLAYVVYAPVPRIIWPGKPTVTPGQYFAQRLGRGTQREQGFSNAINMTVPGELFLNYGWPAVVVGLSLQGLAFALLWSAVGRLRDPRNAVASAIGFMGFSDAFFVGSNAAAVVSTFLVLVLGYALTWLLRAMADRESHGRQKAVIR